MQALMTGEVMNGSRKGKMQIGGHFDPSDVFTLQEILARESRDRGSRKTMQEALEEMLADYAAKHGVKLPSQGGGKARESV
jgi:hypothetical protein